MLTLQYKDKIATVVPEIGMNTCSLKFAGEEILRVPPDMDALKARSEIYGTPLLLPPGRVPEGKFNFEGKPYQLSINDVTGTTHIHGDLRNSAFTIEAQTENSVRGVFVNDGSIYPFPYKATEECVLDDDGYHQKVTIENIGAGNMPMCFGFHTCFAERDYVKLPIDGHMSRGQKQPLDEREQLLAAGGKLVGEIDDSYSLCGHDIVIGDHHYLLSDNFIHMTIWNDDARSNFIALEPQHGTANGLNTGCGLMVLAPGEKMTFETRIV